MLFASCVPLINFARGMGKATILLLSCVFLRKQKKRVAEFIQFCLLSVLLFINFMTDAMDAE